jgi:CRISPR-associated protein Csm2
MIENRSHQFYDSKFLKNEQVAKWINKGPDNELIKQADGFGEYIAKSLKRTKSKNDRNYQNDIDLDKDEIVTTSQIRQIFGKLKAIEAKGFNSKELQTEFLMIKPLLAYASGRHRKTGLERLKERISWGIDAVFNGSEAERKSRFKNFCKLFEAILAYHKAYGGN